jgi:hypothetical protein
MSSLGGGDGLGQMNHFVQNNGMNMFRLRMTLLTSRFDWR